MTIHQLLPLCVLTLVVLTTSLLWHRAAGRARHAAVQAAEATTDLKLLTARHEDLQATHTALLEKYQAQHERHTSQMVELGQYTRDARAHFIGAVGALHELGYELRIGEDGQHMLLPHDGGDIIQYKTDVH